MLESRRRRAGRVLAVACAGLTVGCGAVGAAETDTETTDSPDDYPELPASGPFACPDGGCRFAVVSQTLDDRLDVFSLDGPPGEWGHVGSVSLDLDPDPAGGLELEHLDEPWSVVPGPDALWVTLGHYPEFTVGSILRAPWSALAGEPDLPATAIHDGVDPIPPVTLRTMPVPEAHYAVRHRSGRILVAAFANDRTAPESSWNVSGRLLVVDATAPFDVATLDLDRVPTGDGAEFAEEGCDAARGLVSLGEDHYALACDGVDSGLVVLDVGALDTSDVTDATSSIRGCVASFSEVDRTTRLVAPASSEGAGVAAEVLVVDTAIDFSDTRVWRFSPDCQDFTVAGVPELAFPGGLEAWSTPTGRRVLLSDAGTSDAPTLRVLDEDLAQCNVLSVDVALEAGERLGTILALPDDGGVLVTTGQSDPTAAPWSGGRMLWVPLDGDPCSVDSISTTRIPAPAIDSENPGTWWRAPSVVTIVKGR